MASNKTATDKGKGSTKSIPSSADQDAIRRATKAGRKGGAKKSTMVDDNPHVGSARLAQQRAYAIARSREAAERTRAERQAEAERLRAERQAEAERLRAEQIKSRFINRLGDAVTQVADRQEWSAEERQLACDFITSLIAGDGSSPGLLPTRRREVVEQRFALTCLIQKVPDGTFPGQSTTWYNDRLQSAQDYLDSQVHSRAS